VVFVLTLQRNITEVEVGRLEAAHDLWKSEFPKMSRIQTITVAVGSGPSGLPTPPIGISFDRYKTDGSLDWRVRVGEQQIVINCLNYTRWNEVWGRAKELLRQFSDTIAAPDNRVTGMGLQYIDVFVWEGNVEKYDVKQLLRDDSKMVPASIWDRGPLWHLYQGWFETEGLPRAGRLLKRVHLDAIEGNSQFSVKVNNTLRLDMKTAAQLNKVFGGARPAIEKIYSELHVKSKRVLAELLIEEMAERIDLNA